MNPIVSIQDLSIDFVTEGERTQAVKHISFDVHRGEIVGIVGESGSGKSVTSLSILQLLPSPPASYPNGRILFSQNGSENIDLLHCPKATIQEIRGHKIGMIFQEPMTSLNPVISCGKQVMEALQVHKKLSSVKAKEQTIEWFEKVKLPEPLTTFKKYPHQLSGGQKQRVMIAMAMCCNPSLLICDEPTTALDVTVQKTILLLIKELQQQQNMGIIFITHDLGVVKEIADKVIIMYKGQIVEQNTTGNIFSHPEHAYTKALIACRPALHSKGEKLPIVSDFLEGKKESPVTGKPGTGNTPKLEKVMEVNNLVVQFPSRNNFLSKVKSHFTAVDQVSFTIYKGETLGLVGESGCGKTTLGRTILGLVEPSGGEILYGGKNITHLTNDETKQLRKEVQLVFQDPYSSLNPRLTIGAAIAEPMKILGLYQDNITRKRKVAKLLEQVNLSGKVADRYPHEFSGGQRQRIVIARALALNPNFLVCDESVSALDVSVQAQVLNLLNELKTELGLTLLFISHDLSVVRFMSDRIMVMQKGKIVEEGNAEDIYNNPQNPYTRQLLQSVPHH
ncbi:MAG TPA: ABC transporter ATP-binding protein [Flavisolibacter sp.]|nr:ABC transporter ATP-binding protein [Flavisolibacter sp.]